MLKHWTNAGHQKVVAEVSSPLVDPSTGAQYDAAPIGRSDAVDAAITSAYEAVSIWANTSAGSRARILLRLADLLDEAAEELTEIECRNTGKPRSFWAGAELAHCTDVLRFTAGASRALPGTVGGEYQSGMTSWMRREPLGVVSAIVPWNFPLMMAVWKVAPILAAGNTCVLKPALQTPASALRLAELAVEAGLPRGVLNVVCGDATTGRLLVADSRPAAVAFTGSVQAGREVATTAAATLKRTHLELGGKAPAVVLEDLSHENAMLDTFLHRLCGAALFNAGQSCTAAARIIAVGSVYDEVVTGMQKWSELVSVGPDGDCGPLICEDHLNRVDGYVARRGVHTSMVTGGHRVGSEGFYYAPTVIADVRRSDELAREEVFGPVITIERADTEADAVAAANDSVFGLAASAWTLDQRAALRVSQQLTAGDVWINSHGMQAVEMPHGGCKQSGYGSDLSIESVLGYTRCVHVASWWE